jgi:hypothetical protein
MSKTVFAVFAVVADESGVTVEIRGESTAAVRAYLPHASTALDTLDAQAASVCSTRCSHTATVHALCAKYGVNVGANGQIIAALIAALQAAGPAIEQLLPAIEAIINLFGKTQSTPTS